MTHTATRVGISTWRLDPAHPIQEEVQFVGKEAANGAG
jgi:hypothetical protein